MAGSSNFQLFDPNNTLTLSDSDYQSSARRLNGVVPGIADPPLHNKLFMQISAVAYAIGQVLANAGETVSDINPAALILSIKKIFANPLSFVSTPQTISIPAGGLILPHGLTVAPMFVQYYLVNVTPEANYSTGDVTRIMGGDSNNQNSIISETIDATNITIRYPSNGIGIGDKLTGTSFSITPTNWQLIVKARA